MAQDRFTNFGDKARDKDRLIRDLKQLVVELNTELDECRSRLTEIEARLLAAGIPYQRMHIGVGPCVTALLIMGLVFK